MKSLMMTKYGDIGSSLEVQEVPTPKVGENQILIKNNVNKWLFKLLVLMTAFIVYFSIYQI